jgi:hypothetical protein
MGSDSVGRPIGAGPGITEGNLPMIDAQTQRPLRVADDEVAGPSLMLPVSQLDRIRNLLDRNGIPYWVDQYAISLNGKPEIIFVNFGRSGDAGRVQAILDETG